MKHYKRICLAAIIANGLFGGIIFAQDSTKPATVITINAEQTVGKISPQFYGLMTEEINYSYDGGIYAELIRNRAFKDNPTKPEHWSLAKEGTATGTISLDSIEQKNTALTKNLRLDITSADARNRVVVSNDGFWGIPVHPNTNYTASFYAKAAAGFSGPLTIAIEGNDGVTVWARTQVRAISGEWKKYTVELTTGDVDTSSNNRFTITAENKGTVWFSLVSLFPPTYNNRPNGNRKDIMELLADMKPGFLRFPGGNYLQSNKLENRFNWKNTIGDISQRPTHNNDSWRYHSSDGLGLMEFMGWCEDLKMEPLLAVFDGLLLTKVNPIVGDSLQPYIQDALDEIEFLTGEKSTKWGAVRAKLGHPFPYRLKYVEVGNEDWFDKQKTWDARFTAFYDAIKAKYPAIQVISSAHVTSRVPDMEDIHHYFSFKQSLKLAHKYDSYIRSDAKVFEGEWACREGFPTTNFLGALGDAAFLTGLERNADIVKMSCYAPLFVNVNPGGMQWKSDLIGYNTVSSYGSPSYYVQKAFSTYIGDEAVKSSISNVPLAADTTEQLFYSVTKDSKMGTLFLKVVNVSASALPATLNIVSKKELLPVGLATIISSEKTSDTNSLTDPKKIVPVTNPIQGMGKNITYNFKPYSVTILKLAFK
ncbi:alpha-L-arabinofuranosidase C-terminal domain-containing protein [Parasediminibacterium sp. JCM 36343]|uniref:alpha-L-arabinofuranosidase C-terminal domain-containing protein n=1 Tax=Parasediminibacterium sp. JCM 36343 TaxID=3374279 RepID=UPI00397CE493